MSYFANHATERPVTALDDLIAEQTTTPRRREYADLTPTRHVTRRCPECGGWNGSHTSALCPGWEE